MDLSNLGLLACIQWNDALGQNEDGNCAANNLLNVTSNDGNLNHDPHEQSWKSGVLSSALHNLQD